MLNPAFSVRFTFVVGAFFSRSTFTFSSFFTHVLGNHWSFSLCELCLTTKVRSALGVACVWVFVLIPPVDVESVWEIKDAIGSGKYMHPSLNLSELAHRRVDDSAVAPAPSPASCSSFGGCCAMRGVRRVGSSY